MHRREAAAELCCGFFLVLGTSDVEHTQLLCGGVALFLCVCVVSGSRVFDVTFVSTRRGKRTTFGLWFLRFIAVLRTVLGLLLMSSCQAFSC